MTSVPTITADFPKLGEGIYTLADAARFLGIPLPKMRSWVSGYLRDDERRYPAGTFKARGEGRERTFDFLTLVEVFIVARLREEGVSMKTIKTARAELSKRFKTDHPFALRGILSDGSLIMKSLGKNCLLELGSGGLQSFEPIVSPFCKKLDFDQSTTLAKRFHPDGRKSPIVIDPQRAFGKPVVGDTNLTTEMVATMIRGGDRIEEVAKNYDLEFDDVRKAWEFEQRIAA